MNHGAVTALDHLRDQQAIEPNGREQIEVELGTPILVGQGREPARRRRGATDDMSQDVDAAQPIERSADEDCAALGRRRVRLDIVDALYRVFDRAGL